MVQKNQELEQKMDFFVKETNERIIKNLKETHDAEMQEMNERVIRLYNSINFLLSNELVE